jgi:fatty acid desaturase
MVGAVPLIHLSIVEHRSVAFHTNEEVPVLWTIAVVLIALWALGLTGGYAMGGLIHLLLVLAIIAVAFRFLSGRRLA